MIMIETANWKRISKAKARMLYNKGKAVFCLPCKMNPENEWMQPLLMRNEESVTFESGLHPFDRMVIRYTHYNCCDREVGLYPAFYVNKRYLYENGKEV